MDLCVCEEGWKTGGLTCTLEQSQEQLILPICDEDEDTHNKAQ